MSADNGVYIFPIYKNKKCVGYVVSEMGAVENTQYNPTHDDGYNHGWCGFEHEKMFKTLLQALRKAEEVADNLPICEYGVALMPPYHIDAIPLREFNEEDRKPCRWSI